MGPGRGSLSPLPSGCGDWSCWDPVSLPPGTRPTIPACTCRGLAQRTESNTPQSRLGARQVQQCLPGLACCRHNDGEERHSTQARPGMAARQGAIPALAAVPQGSGGCSGGLLAGGVQQGGGLGWPCQVK